jgi:hypothetical protein
MVLLSRKLLLVPKRSNLYAKASPFNCHSPKRELRVYSRTALVIGYILKAFDVVLVDGSTVKPKKLNEPIHF